MKQLNTYIVEKLKIDKDSEYESELDKEMKEWDKRMQSPFGKTLKELQCAVIDLGLYPMTKNEYGLTICSPFDNYDYSHHTKIKKLLEKLESLV